MSDSVPLAASAAQPPPQPLPLLRQPNFRRFWLSRWASTLSGQMMMVALGWQMYDLTGSAWDLGLVGLVQFMPALLLALPAGQVVDRVERRRVLMAALLAQATVALLLAWGSLGQHIGRDSILALSVVLGSVRAFLFPATHALLPQLVARPELPRAMALASAALQGAIIVGPALGGALYGLGVAVVYAVAALGFGVALVCMAGVRPRAMAPAVGTVGWSSVLAGLHFIRHRPVILGAISLDLFAGLLGGATALLPIFARDVLQAGPVALGLLRSAPAVGALAMSLALARWPLQRRVGPWLIGSAMAFGVAMGIFGASTHILLSMAALALSGAADMVSVVIRQTLVQLETPDDMRGRVSAVNAIFIGASNQLGEFESGATAAKWGAVASVVGGGVATVAIAALWTRLFPALARRDRWI